MQRIIYVEVRDLQPGDKVLDKGALRYTVLEIEKYAHYNPDWNGQQMAKVEWLDGGRDVRVWGADQLSQEVQIAREVG